MTEPTERKPLKRTIPPDLQKQVEDIQIKVPRTTGQPDDLDDQKKRWLIVGICLHTIISPVLRKYVVPVVTKLCYSLTSRNQVHKQTYGSYLKRYAPTNTELNYEAINNNKTLYGRNRARYDYKVKSAIDLSRLFLQTHMAHFTAFDDSCDSSALLGIIVNIDKFPMSVQYDAKQYVHTFSNQKDELPKDELLKDESPKDDLTKDDLPKDELPIYEITLQTQIRNVAICARDEHFGEEGENITGRKVTSGTFTIICKVL